MNSWLVWLVLVIFCVLLGFVGYHFTVRTLRFLTGLLALAAVVVITRYGVAHHGSGTHADLVNSFTLGFDALSNAFFRPLLGHNIPIPGRIGWLVIVGLLVFGYRELEVWAMCWQPPTVDLSALGGDQSDPQNGNVSSGQGTVTADRIHGTVANDIRFRLPAVAVRAPAILPGGTRMAGLVSIAESTGNTTGGLAGAVIDFVGALWPNPRQYQVRIRVEPPVDKRHAARDVRVTVDLENPRTGGNIATKTLAVRRLDEAGSVVAGYVARQVFGVDPSAPPWCYGSFDGSDLAALLTAWQVRTYPKCPGDISAARATQRDILEKGASGGLCAGVVRYELAQLHDIDGFHVEALRLHAINREQYPRFYRGRYRLGMSLEMLANPKYKLSDEDAKEVLCDCLETLVRCGAIRNPMADVKKRIKPGKPLPRSLRMELLTVAQDELCAVRRQLSLPWLVWSALAHRDERAIWGHYWRLAERERFHDGVRVAELLVAVRKHLNGTEDSDPDLYSGQGRIRATYNLWRARQITTAITGDNKTIKAVLEHGVDPGPGNAPPGREPRSSPAAVRTRWALWQLRTPSWQAAYNTACLYAALAAAYDKEKMTHQAVASLKRTINDPHCELGRPSAWIGKDPDFSAIESSKDFKMFLEGLWKADHQEVNPIPAHR